ncbi:deoxyribose-phosphate aldolase [uncultured Selenomonas sp.]|uniref:deoxyribose-phosphate aldolase n=1 Tax=uncultured Selenomonas sp. TaxID=159275 RepID=UPI0028D653A7|nr:deoxyribose-phosphate aldolase [uncultured Selenomonas sp.]
MDFAKMIDHTLLKTDARQADLDKLLNEAKAYHFASVCVSPVWVAYAAEQLRGSGVKTCTVIGFPQGATPSAVKAFEARRAIEDGAEEVDMVIPVGRLKDQDYDYVRADIAAVVAAAKGKALTKVIIETCLLTDEEKRTACRLAKEAGADFVKTSTGFSAGGATAADVRLMRETVGTEMGVKASGGVRSRADAEAMVAAGASRLGTSSGVQIVAGEKEDA